MDKQEAIEIIRKIQRDELERIQSDEVPLGSMGKKHWESAEFQLGMKYGQIAILMRLFDIKGEEL